VIDLSEVWKKQKARFLMDALLASVVAAHGGLDRWSAIETLTARLSMGGPFWDAKGQPNLLIDKTIELDTRREHLVCTPYTDPDRHSVFDVDPERLTIQTTDGVIVEQRVDPRASFAGYDSSTRWDVVQVAYFISYAMWNYLTSPFLLTYPGVEAHEIEPWQEEGQTWRRLHVTFPSSIVTHSPEQIFYYDAHGMQRRLDYMVQVNGDAAASHYTEKPRTFGGLVFPTRRTICPRLPDNTTDRSMEVITVDITDIAFNVRK
jgi:hypothetical protein